MRPASAIETERLYTLSEARLFLASPLGGGQPLAVKTLRRWRQQGHLHAERRLVGKRVFWFVRGTELLRLLAQEERRQAEEGDGT